MILRALEKHGELTIHELKIITGASKEVLETELRRLKRERKICIEHGLCYITPKTSFPTMLLVAFLLFVCSFVLIGAVKASL